MRGMVIDHRHDFGVGERTRVDPLDQQPVDRPAHVESLAKQCRTVRRCAALGRGNVRGEAEPAADGFDRGRYVRPRAKRIEHGSQRLVEVEIAHHRHPWEQKPARQLPHECLGHHPFRAAVGEQQGQPREPEIGFGIARNQPRDERVGKTAVRGDRIDPGARGLSHRPARLR